MRHGNLFVISGPSGAGKGTLVARLMHEVEDTWLSVSATTRDPRENEVDGVNYLFMSRERFFQMVDADEFLEWAEYSGNCYGSPAQPVYDHMNAQKQVILEIDVQGAFQVKEKVPACHMVFIEPPSMEELERRLRGRGSEDEQKIQQRLAAARVELARKSEYDIQLVNDDLDDAAARLVAYVNEHAELPRD